MNFDDYENLWRAQRAPTPAWTNETADRAEALDRIREEARRFDRAVFWRDTREIAAAFLVAALFAAGAWNHTENGYVPWGRWIATAITLGVALTFLAARRRSPRPPEPELPLIEQTDRALSVLRAQAGLLRRVPRDYAAPMCVATLCAGLDPLYERGGGAALWSGTGAFVVAVALLVAAFVVWLNRFAVRRVLEPKIAELERIRGALTPGDASPSFPQTP